MAAALGSCIGSCAGSCAIGACCSMCSCKCLSSAAAANLMYCTTIFLGSVLAVSLRYGRVDLNIGAQIGTQGVSVCTGSDCSGAAFALCNSETCKGYWAVYRISFALASYHLLLAILTVCRGRFSAMVHLGYWFAKFALIACVLVGSLFASNDLFAIFSWVARFVAPYFLLLQLIYWIDLGYTLNASLVEKDERDGGNAYKALNLILACLLLIASLVGVGVMYSVFGQDCPFNPLAITTTLLFNLGNTALSISPVAEHGSLLCSALIFTYSTWLCYSALAAFPSETCNPTHSDDAHVGALLTSSVVAIISISYLAYRAGSDQIGANAMSGGPSKAPTLEMADLGSAGGANAGSTPPSNDEVVVVIAGERTPAEVREERGLPSDQRFVFYHIKFFAIACYVAMLMTDWGVPSSSSQSKLSSGYASAWIMMSANWLCQLLYCWTLVAPKACPGRSFD